MSAMEYAMPIPFNSYNEKYTNSVSCGSASYEYYRFSVCKDIIFIYHILNILYEPNPNDYVSLWWLFHYLLCVHDLFFSSFCSVYINFHSFTISHLGLFHVHCEYPNVWLKWVELDNIHKTIYKQHRTCTTRMLCCRYIWPHHAHPSNVNSRFVITWKRNVMLWSFFIGIGEKAFSKKKMNEKEEAGTFIVPAIGWKNNSTAPRYQKTTTRTTKMSICQTIWNAYHTFHRIASSILYAMCYTFDILSKLSRICVL